MAANSAGFHLSHTNEIRSERNSNGDAILCVDVFGIIVPGTSAELVVGLNERAVRAARDGKEGRRLTKNSSSV